MYVLTHFLELMSFGVLKICIIHRDVISDECIHNSSSDCWYFSLHFLCTTEKTVGTDQPSYTVTEFEDPQLNFNVPLSGPTTPGPGRLCVVTITAVPGTALSKWWGASLSARNTWMYNCTTVRSFTCFTCFSYCSLTVSASVTQLSVQWSGQSFRLC